MNRFKPIFTLCLLAFLGIAQAFASVENASIGYKLYETSRPVETELSTITVEWEAKNSEIWSAYVHTDYRPDEYDASKILYTLDVKRNGKSVTRATSSEDAYTDYSHFPYHFIQTFTLSEAQTKPGTYTIDLPRGIVCDMLTPAYAKNVNDAATITFVIEGEGGDDDDDDPKPSIPAGEMVLLSGGPDIADIPDGLDTIVWEWATADGDPCLWYGPATLNVKCNNEKVATATVSNRKITDSDGKDVWQIVLQMDLPVENTGRYIIEVPEGAVGNSTTESEITIRNKAMTLEYAVLAPAGVAPYIVYPDFDARVEYASGESFKTIALQYAKPISVNPEKMPFLFNEAGERIYADEIRSFTLEDTGTLLVDFHDADKLPTGRYSLIVPRGAVVGGDAVRINYYWEGAPEEKGKDEPLELLKAQITVSGTTFNLLDPKNGIDFVPDLSQIKLSTNYDDICDTYYYSIIDVTGLAEDADPTLGDPVIINFIYSSTGFSQVIYTPAAKSFKFTADHEYVVYLECYSDYQTILKKHQGNLVGPRFHGGAPAYQYSPARLLNVEPAPGGEFSSSTVITMTFDMPVDFDYDKSGIPMGQQGSERLATYVPNADKTVWRFTLPSSTLENFSGPNSINIRFTFNDLNGRRVRPSNLNVPESDNSTPLRNMGSEESSNICVWYGTYAGCSAFNVSPMPGEPVKSLYEFHYTFGNGSEINPSWLGGKLNLTDEEGNVVATMICDAPDTDGGNVRLVQTGDENDPKTVEVQLHLDRQITTPGVYRLNYPYAYFAMGREQNASNSKPVLHTYVVEEAGTMSVDFILAEDIPVDAYDINGFLLGTMLPNELQNFLAGKHGFYILRQNGMTKKVCR